MSSFQREVFPALPKRVQVLYLNAVKREERAYTRVDLYEGNREYDRAHATVDFIQRSWRRVMAIVRQSLK